MKTPRFTIHIEAKRREQLERGKNTLSSRETVDKGGGQALDQMKLVSKFQLEKTMILPRKRSIRVLPKFSLRM